MTRIKEELYQKCVEYVEQRIAACQKAIQHAQSAANEETKSSAGDKYETGRAMMQLEIEKQSVQLAEAMKLQQALTHIHPDKVHEQAELGSLVYTTQGTFYISISAGQIKVNNEVFFAVSPVSPIAARLLGNKQGYTFSFNGKEYSIQSVS